MFLQQSNVPPTIHEATQIDQLCCPHMAWLSPLYGGGFRIGFLQLSLVYYTSAVFLHFVLPRLINVRSVQGSSKRQPGDLGRDALCSLGVDHFSFLLIVSKPSSIVWITIWIKLRLEGQIGLMALDKCIESTHLWKHSSLSALEFPWCGSKPSCVCRAWFYRSGECARFCAV